MKNKMKKHITTIMAGVICCLIFTAAQTTQAQKLPKDLKIPDIKSDLKVSIDFAIGNKDVYKDGFLAACSEITIKIYRANSDNKIGKTVFSEMKASGPAKNAKNGECTATFLLPIKWRYFVRANYTESYKSTGDTIKTEKPLFIKPGETNFYTAILHSVNP